MKARNLLLRCFADKNEFGWQAFCIDFDLAAQGATLDEARDRLRGMIAEYVEDAMIGDDQQYAEAFLSRRSPWQLVLKYHLYRLWNKVQSRSKALAPLAFRSPLPVAPAHAN